ncbi:hypothetical protein DXU07_42085 [Bradyrhizobium elkanii]
MKLCETGERPADPIALIGARGASPAEADVCRLMTVVQIPHHARASAASGLPRPFDSGADVS